MITLSLTDDNDVQFELHLGTERQIEIVTRLPDDEATICLLSRDQVVVLLHTLNSMLELV